MNRPLAMLAFAHLSLRRRPWRSAVGVLALGMGVAAFGSVLLFEAALRHESARTLRSAPTLTVQRVVGGRAALIGLDHVAEIASLPGVRRAAPRIWGLRYVAAAEANVTVAAVAALRDLAPSVADGPAEFRERDVVLGHALAEWLAVRAGDHVALGEEPHRVAAVLREDIDLFAADAVLAEEPLARELLGLPEGLATDLAVDATTADEANVLSAKITRLDATYRVLDNRALARGYALTLGSVGGALSTFLFPGLFFLTMLAMERVFGFSNEERREIGLLKALGFSTRDVLVAKLFEAVVLGALGISLGVALAYAHVHVLGAPLLRHALLGWSALLPTPALPYAAGIAELLGLIVGLGLPFVGLGLLPAWRAALVDPDEVLRGGEP